jgi:hypothetical protein
VILALAPSSLPGIQNQTSKEHNPLQLLTQPHPQPNAAETTQRNECAIGIARIWWE